MLERKYAYNIGNIYIVYHLGKYCIAHIHKSERGAMVEFVRQYKTLRGAETYLLRDYPHADRNAPEIKYATDTYIRQGEYWKGE